jgi:hypothetical protein
MMAETTTNDRATSAQRPARVEPHVRSSHYRVVGGRRVAVRPAVVNHAAAAWTKRAALSLALDRVQGSGEQGNHEARPPDLQAADALDLVDLAFVEERFMREADEVIEAGIDGYHRLTREEAVELAMARVRLTISDVAGDSPALLFQAASLKNAIERRLLAASLSRLGDEIFRRVGERLEESPGVGDLEFRLAYLQAFEARMVAPLPC